MWSVPYNLNIYSSYFGVGKTLSTCLTTSGADSPYHKVSDHFLTPVPGGCGQTDHQVQHGYAALLVWSDDQLQVARNYVYK